MGMDRDDIRDKREQLDELALDVLKNTRSTLLMSFRFLDRALFKMPFTVREDPGYIGTDGESVYFGSFAVVARWSQSTDDVTRDMLHMVMHCVFYHPFVSQEVDPWLWGIACDVVAEAAGLELAGERFPCPLDDERRNALATLTNEYGVLSAEKLYRAFTSGTATRGPDAAELYRLFTRDDHSMWFVHGMDAELAEAQAASCGQEGDASQGSQAGDGTQAAEGQQQSSGTSEQAGDGEGEGSEDASQGGQQAEGMREQAGAGLPQPGSGGGGGQDVGEAAAPEELSASRPEDVDRLRAQWSDITKQLKVALEASSAQYGTQPAFLSAQLERITRRKQDYREFLRRFAELSEDMCVNDDDFDPIFYTFGLATYGNMPLVEPLEFRESYKVRDFVIAIDTSGSVQGPLVKRFVEEAYTILTSSAGFYEHVNVHIVQCDAAVQSDVALHSRAEFDEYMRGFEVLGMGGTDFRPVFAYVDELVAAGEFERLKGLLYFTDGYGQYPSEAPVYDAAFAFIDSGQRIPTVPAWAFRLIVSEDDLNFELQRDEAAAHDGATLRDALG